QARGDYLGNNERKPMPVKEKFLHVNRRDMWSKSFHHPYRPRLRRRSTFMKRYPLSFSSRRLSKRQSKLLPQALTRWQKGQISKQTSPPCSVQNLICAKQSSFVKF